MKKCGHFTGDANLGTEVYFASASQLSGLVQDVREGKLYGVIPTAIGTTAVVKVIPTEQSSKEVQQALQKTEEAILSAALSKPSVTKSADRNLSALKGLLP